MKISRQKVKDQLAATIEDGKTSQRMLNDLLKFSFAAAIDEDVFYSIVEWCSATKNYVDALEDILNTFDKGKWMN